MTKTKIDWIRDDCTDMFEGIPCDYPKCSCSPENKARREKDYRSYIRRLARRDRAAERTTVEQQKG